VQRSLDRVEVIVKVLPEADQERERLVQPVFQVSGEKGETDHSVRISHLCRFWEKRRYLVREFQIVIHYWRRVFDVSLAVWKLEQENSRECLISLIVELQSERNGDAVLLGDDPVFLIRSVRELARVGRVSGSSFKLFQRSSDRSTEEVLLEAGELRANFFHNFVSFLSNLFILCLDLCLLSLVQIFTDFLSFRQLGYVDAERNVIIGQELTLRELILLVQLVEDLLATVHKNLLWAIALECEFNHLLPHFSWHVVYAVVVVEGLFLDQDISIITYVKG